MNKRVIYKYPLELQGLNIIEMPKGAEILSIQEQLATITIWAILNPDEETKEKRFFEIYGTGQPFPVNRNYNWLATCVMKTGFVWHVFETTNF
jgi:hypothetical protein